MDPGQRCALAVGAAIGLAAGIGIGSLAAGRSAPPARHAAAHRGARMAGAPPRISAVAINVVGSRLTDRAVSEAMAAYVAAVRGLPIVASSPRAVYRWFNGRLIVIGSHLYRVQVRVIWLGSHTVVVVHPVPVDNAEPM